jgi:hypothetical protein
VVLSLEDKSLQQRYPSSWIILKEPVSDIHSLIYYSRLVVSSGDSMAREGAMLGVPAVYCGIRDMKANQLLIDTGGLFHYPLDTGIDTINRLAHGPVDEPARIAFRECLEEDWIDMTAFMHTQINLFKK